MTVEERQDAQGHTQDYQAEQIANLKKAMYFLIGMVAVAMLVIVVVSFALSRSSSKHDVKTTAAEVKREIRAQVNEVVSAACRTSSRDLYRKHNSLVRAIIQARARSAANDLANGDLVQRKIDLNAVKVYRTKFIHVPTDQECDVPLLKDPATQPR